MSGYRQPTSEEQAVIVAAYSMREIVQNDERRAAGSTVERFLASTAVWGNEQDHFEELFGVKVLHDPTLPKGTLLYAIGKLVEK